MGRRDRSTPGRRRHTLQLDSSANLKTNSYLANHGCYRPDDDVWKDGKHIKEKHVKSLVVDYDDSDEDTDSITNGESDSVNKEKVEPSNHVEKLVELMPSSPQPQLQPQDTDHSEKLQLPQQHAESKDKNIFPASDIDSQVASFLAEIDALGGSDAACDLEEVVSKKEGDQKWVKGDVQGMGDVPDGSQPQKSEVCSATEEMESDEGEDEVDWPEEPQSVWQQCMDDNTGCCYYWNVDTNEVTWEIPPEFTQYLLLFREFEEKVEKLKKEGKVPKKSKTKSENKQDGIAENKEIPPAIPVDICGPHLLTDNKQQQTDDADDESLLFGPQLPPKLDCSSEVPAEFSPPSNSQPLCEADENSNCGLDTCAVQFKDSEMTSASPVNADNEERSDIGTKDEKKMEGVLVSNGAEMETLPKPIENNEEMDLDIDELDRELELALERKKKELKRLEEEERMRSKIKLKPILKKKVDQPNISSQKDSQKIPDPPSHDMKPQKKLKSILKKKHDIEHKKFVENEEPEVKRSKMVDSNEEDITDGHHSPIHSSLEETTEVVDEQGFKEDVLDLNELVLSKLEFLDIAKKGLSKLQILLIELETRSTDWHAGGLSTKYFYGKLQEANRQLQQYEQSAAPLGWSCNWDRTYRRYYYTDDVSGNSQWDYPDVADNLDDMPSPSSNEQDVVPTKEVDNDSTVDAAVNTKEKVMSSKREEETKSKPDSQKPSLLLIEEPEVYPGEPPPPGTEPFVQPTLVGPCDSSSKPCGLVDDSAGDDMDIDQDDDEGCILSSDFLRFSNSQDISSTQSAAVISKPPQYNRPVSSESATPSTSSAVEANVSSTSCSSFDASSLTSVPPTSTSNVESQASVHTAISSDLVSRDSSSSPMPPDTSAAEIILHAKEKKKKKDKVITSTNLALKKKNVSSLVQKWQKVKKEVEKEEELQRQADFPGDE